MSAPQPAAASRPDTWSEFADGAGGIPGIRAACLAAEAAGKRVADLREINLAGVRPAIVFADGAVIAAPEETDLQD